MMAPLTAVGLEGSRLVEFQVPVRHRVTVPDRNIPSVWCRHAYHNAVITIRYTTRDSPPSPLPISLLLLLFSLPLSLPTPTSLHSLHSNSINIYLSGYHSILLSYPRLTGPATDKSKPCPACRVHSYPCYRASLLPPPPLHPSSLSPSSSLSSLPLLDSVHLCSSESSFFSIGRQPSILIVYLLFLGLSPLQVRLRAPPSSVTLALSSNLRLRIPEATNI